MTPADIDALATYRGVDPIPADFDVFWAARMAEADAVPLAWRVEPAEVPATRACTYLNLWFRGMHGARLYARYLRPRAAGPLPLVLQFHGYPGASRSWFEQSSFVGMGCALIALDNPGQGGRSEDVGGFAGTTVAGHLVAGADGPAANLYYVRLYQNLRILCRIVAALAEAGAIDATRVFVNGASQGGGMGIACCALNPKLVNRAAILYPFLSDFRRVSEMDADTVAYEGLRYWSRWFDPDGTRAAALFDKLAYVDTKNFAHLVRCPVHFGTGLADTVCPPVTQCAAYNALTCDKTRTLYPGMGHEEIAAFDDATLRFFGDALASGRDASADDAARAGAVTNANTSADTNPATAAGGAVLVARDLGNPGARYAELRLRAVDGAPLVARCVAPVAAGPHPLVLLFGDCGRDARGWHHLTRYAGAGLAVVHLQNRANDNAGTSGDARTGDDAFDLAVADACAAFDAAAALAGVCAERIATFGEGFGGALALAVAAVRPVCRAAALNPYPVDALLDRAADVACSVLLGTSGMDELAPQNRQNVLYSRLPNAEQKCYPKYAHERINAFEDELLRYLHDL